MTINHSNYIGGFDNQRVMWDAAPLNLSDAFGATGGLSVNNNNASAPIPVVTPYPTSGGNPAIPSTQTGQPYTQNYSGTIDPTTYAVGTTLPQNTWNAPTAPNAPYTSPGPGQNGYVNPNSGKGFQPGQNGYVNPNTQGTNAYGQTSDQVAQAQSAYDAAVNTLQGFIPLLQNQAQTSSDAVNNSVGQTVAQAQSGEDALNNQTNNAVNSQNTVLKSALGGNNAYAASFGSGLSSFGEGLNNQTYQNFGNTIGGLQNNQQTGTQQFEQSKVAAQQWGGNQLKSIQDQLNQGLQQVALNVNQTDIQRANAVTQIQQQAQAQANSINSIVAQLQSNIAASQNQALMYSQLYAGQNPQLSANIQQLSSDFASGANKNIGTIFPQATGIYGSDVKLDANGNPISQ